MCRIVFVPKFNELIRIRLYYDLMHLAQLYMLDVSMLVLLNVGIKLTYSGPKVIKVVNKCST